MRICMHGAEISGICVRVCFAGATFLALVNPVTLSLSVCDEIALLSDGLLERLEVDGALEPSIATHVWNEMANLTTSNLIS